MACFWAYSSVHDNESSLYYLQSRYYDPQLGRFINGDATTVTGQGFAGNNMFVYCGNNPIIRRDTAGYAFETIFDVITLGLSIAEVAANPYDPMAWIGLAGDLVDIIPFVTGVGETVRGLRFIDKAGDVVEIAESADNAVDTYKSLRRLNKGKGNEVHHIIEKRFADALGIKNTDEMLSVALSKGDHKAYTSAWRKNLAYGKKNVERLELFQTAANIYKDTPQLMGAAVMTICMQ